MYEIVTLLVHELGKYKAQKVGLIRKRFRHRQHLQLRRNKSNPFVIDPTTCVPKDLTVAFTVLAAEGGANLLPTLVHALNGLLR